MGDGNATETPFSDLPDHVWCCIFSHSSVTRRQKASMRQTCSRFRKLVNSTSSSLVLNSVPEVPSRLTEAGFDNVKTLTLSDGPIAWWSPEVVTALLKQLGESGCMLERVNLQGCLQLSGGLVKQLCSFPRLRYLTLPDSSPRDDGWPHLSRLSHLTHLKVVPSEHTLELATQLPSLQHITPFPAIDSSHAQFILPHLLHLTSVTIRLVSATCPALQTLRTLPNLKSLQLFSHSVALPLLSVECWQQICSLLALEMLDLDGFVMEHVVLGQGGAGHGVGSHLTSNSVQGGNNIGQGGSNSGQGISSADGRTAIEGSLGSENGSGGSNVGSTDAACATQGSALRVTAGSTHASAGAGSAGVSSTGAGSTGTGNTGVSSAGTSSFGASSTVAGSTGTSSFNVGSTGMASSGTGTTGNDCTGRSASTSLTSSLSNSSGARAAEQNTASPGRGHASSGPFSAFTWPSSFRGYNTASRKKSARLTHLVLKDCLDPFNLVLPGWRELQALSLNECLFSNVQMGHMTNLSQLVGLTKLELTCVWRGSGVLAQWLQGLTPPEVPPNLEELSLKCCGLLGCSLQLASFRHFRQLRRLDLYENCILSDTFFVGLGQLAPLSHLRQLRVHSRSLNPSVLPYLISTAASMWPQLEMDLSHVQLEQPGDLKLCLMALAMLSPAQRISLSLQFAHFLDIEDTIPGDMLELAKVSALTGLTLSFTSDYVFQRAAESLRRLPNLPDLEQLQLYVPPRSMQGAWRVCEPLLGAGVRVQVQVV